MKRTALRRRAGLSRKPPAPATGMSAPLAMVLAAEATVAQAARIHGVDPDALERLAWETVKAAVMERDGYRCQYSGVPATDVQHRVARGMGGTADPKIAFGMANLVAMSREAHELAEKRGERMNRYGYWLRRTQDPELEPVITFTPSGWVPVWLTSGGGRSYEPPAERAA